MPARPKAWAGFQAESLKPGFSQPVPAVVPARQEGSVATTSGSPSANSTRTSAMRPAGLAASPTLATLAARTFSPGRRCGLRSTTVAAWKLLAVPACLPLTNSATWLSPVTKHVARRIVRSLGMASVRRK